ncbi:hypothetical protein ACLOJK_012697 [Asimina triloba]
MPLFSFFLITATLFLTVFCPCSNCLTDAREKSRIPPFPKWPPSFSFHRGGGPRLHPVSDSEEMALARQWLAEIGFIRTSSSSATAANKPSCSNAQTSSLGILAFETAKAMSRLLCLHASLTDSELHSLRCSVFRADGVARLNSSDDGFLIRLACTEKLEDLDRAAFVVARLGRRCSSPELQRFDRTYADVKLGTVDFSKSTIPAKKLEKNMKKMEKWVSATSALYAGLELLSELEVSERKLQALWGNGPIQFQVQKPKSGLFDEKAGWQRRHVKSMRAASLWNLPLQKIVQLMAKMVCNVFERLCIVFGPYVSDLPQVLQDRNLAFVVSSKLPLTPKQLHGSGPLDRWMARSKLVARFSSKNLKHQRSGSDLVRSKTEKEFQIQEISFGFVSSAGQQIRAPRRTKRITAEASPTTVGHAALALLYASVIIMADKILNRPDTADEEMREGLYQKLPFSLRKSVKFKMRGFCAGAFATDESVVVRWKEDVKDILQWLLPMARDTVQWQAERNFDRQQFDLRPTVLLLQTLYFSDKEKTDEAIAEVLVGLSRILLCKAQFPDLFEKMWNENGGDEARPRESRSAQSKRHLLRC